MKYLLDTDSFIVAEVLHGADYSTDPAASLLSTHTLISQLCIVDLDTAIADTFGEIKADLRRLGLLIADFDLLIGATAIMAGRTPVTNNARHFLPLSAHGLLLENWKA